ncbi:arsenate reductase (glutaredoxin) [Salinibius halmophilus]|uniref:arsenate reductase (glutaredoxin) n=1 Tax=Salinibius halmophilus TaxID=1853216 RepID=UPI000E6681CF|nr:arsenate reductase (glutaredoxin) [Salinibius halmophilus]
MSINIYHNPRCSKSRQTLALIEHHQPKVIKYLDTPLTLEELKRVAEKLDLGVSAMIRPKEAEFVASGLTLASEPDDLLAFLAEHPKAMERPIVETSTQARIGRPPENVLDILP